MKMMLTMVVLGCCTAQAADFSAVLEQFYIGKRPGYQLQPMPGEVIDAYKWEGKALAPLPADAVMIMYLKEKPAARALMVLGWKGRYQDFIGTDALTFLGKHKRSAKVDQWMIEKGKFKGKVGFFHADATDPRQSLILVADLNFLFLTELGYEDWFRKTYRK